MRDTKLLEQALGLSKPWKVVKVNFNADEKRLDIHLDFSKGGKFKCSGCGELSSVYDTKEKEWRHLNFFQHECYLHARTPRTACDKCGVRLVEVPWSRPQSGFTLLFEALVMQLCQMMPVNAVSRLIGETDNRIWRVIEHHVEEARQEMDLSEVEHVGMDETSVKKGHNYITMFVDMDKRRAIDVEEGKNAEVVEKFIEELTEHGGEPEQVTDVCCDMSPAFIRGLEDHLSDASITFDRYHVMKLLNKAVDSVRKRESREQGILRKTKYLWLKNQKNLTEKQEIELEKIMSIKNLNLQTVKAYHIRENFKMFYEINDKNKAEKHLKTWFWWATHSRIEEMREAAWAIKRHWGGVLNWYRSKISNGLLEGLNSLFQAAKAKARGYRSLRKIRVIIYLLLGKLEFALPEVLPT